MGMYVAVFIVGLFLGIAVGFVLTALMAAAKREDDITYLKDEINALHVELDKYRGKE